MRKTAIFFLALLLLMTLALTGCGDDPPPTDPTNPTEPANPDLSDTYDTADNQFAYYIINMAKDIAANNSLLESTVGDVTAHKMTVEEVAAKAEEYKTIILENINNEEVVANIREENGIRYYEFYIENSLNILGVGTHMSIGFPNYLEVITVDDDFGYWITAVFSCNI